MEKVYYWLKKLGIMRSATYKVKGDASKLAEMHAKDGGMIQSQKEIDKQHARKGGTNNSSQEDERGKTKILFWIFAILAVFFLLAYFGSGFSFGSFLATIFWVIFLLLLWKGKAAWTTSFVKVLVVGLVLTIVSLTVVDSPETEKSNLSDADELAMLDSQKKDEVAPTEAEEECDDSNSKNASFNKIEKVIVSKNPCEVPWILAKESESYTLETNKGTELNVIVWNNYVDNVKAGESYTIRALDIEDSQRSGHQDAGIAIVRWVPNKAALAQAKAEIKKLVEDLDY